jgi:hypothetical protein
MLQSMRAASERTEMIDEASRTAQRGEAMAIRTA